MKGQSCAASERARHRKSLLSKNSHHRKQKWKILALEGNCKKARYIALSQVHATTGLECRKQTLENVNNSQNDDSTTGVKTEGNRNSSSGFFNSFARAFSGEMENFFGIDASDLANPEPLSRQTEVSVPTPPVVELKQSLPPPDLLCNSEKVNGVAEPIAKPIITEQIQQLDAEIKMETTCNCMQMPLKMPLEKQEVVPVKFLNANFFTNFKRSKAYEKPYKRETASRVPYVSACKASSMPKSFKDYLMSAGKKSNELKKLDLMESDDDLDNMKLLMVDTVVPSGVDVKGYTFPEMDTLATSKDHTLLEANQLNDAKKRAIQEANNFDVAKDFALLEANEFELAKDQALQEADMLKVASNHALQEATHLHAAKESALKEANKLEIAKERALQKASQIEVAKEHLKRSPPCSPVFKESLQNSEVPKKNDGERKKGGDGAIIKSRDTGIESHVDGKNEIKIAAANNLRSKSYTKPYKKQTASGYKQQNKESKKELIDSTSKENKGVNINMPIDEKIESIKDDKKDIVKEQTEQQNDVAGVVKNIDHLAEKLKEQISKTVDKTSVETLVAFEDKVNIGGSDDNTVTKIPSDNQENKTSELLTNIEKKTCATIPSPEKGKETFKFEPVIDINSKSEIQNEPQAPVSENKITRANQPNDSEYDQVCIFTSGATNEEQSLVTISPAVHYRIETDQAWSSLEDDHFFNSCNERNILPDTNKKIEINGSSALKRTIGQKLISENASNTEYDYQDTMPLSTDNVLGEKKIEMDTDRAENIYSREFMNPIDLPDGDSVMTDTTDSCDRDYTTCFYHDDEGEAQPIYSQVPNDNDTLLIEYFANMEKDTVSREQQVNIKAVEQLLPLNNTDSAKHPDSVLNAIQAYNGLTAVYINNKNKAKKCNEEIANNLRSPKSMKTSVAISNTKKDKLMSEILDTVSNYKLVKKPNINKHRSSNYIKFLSMNRDIKEESKTSKDPVLLPTFLEPTLTIDINSQFPQIESTIANSNKVEQKNEPVNSPDPPQPILEDILFYDGQSEVNEIADNAVFHAISSIMDNHCPSAFPNKRIELQSKYNNIPIGNKSRKLLTSRSRLRCRSVTKPTMKSVSFLRSIQRKLSPKSWCVSTRTNSKRCYHSMKQDSEHKKQDSFAFDEHNPDGGIGLSSHDRRTVDAVEREPQEQNIVTSFNTMFSGLSDGNIAGECLQQSKSQIKDIVIKKPIENNAPLPLSLPKQKQKKHTFYNQIVANKEKEIQLKKGHGTIRKPQFKNPFASKKRALNLNTGAFLTMMQQRKVEPHDKVDELPVKIGKELITEDNSIENIQNSSESQGNSDILSKENDNDLKRSDKKRLVLSITKPLPIDWGDVNDHLNGTDRSITFSIVKTPTDALIDFSDHDSIDTPYMGSRPPRVDLKSIQDCGNQAWGNIFTEDVEFFQNDDTVDEIASSPMDQQGTITEEGEHQLTEEETVAVLEEGGQQLIEEGTLAGFVAIPMSNNFSSQNRKSVPFASFLESTKHLSNQNLESIQNSISNSKNLSYMKTSKVTHPKTKAKASGIKASMFLKSLRQKVDKTAGQRIQIAHGAFSKKTLSPPRKRSSAKIYSAMSPMRTSPKRSTVTTKLKPNESQSNYGMKRDSPEIFYYERETALEAAVSDIKKGEKAVSTNTISPKTRAKVRKSPSRKDNSKKTSLKSSPSFEGSDVKAGKRSVKKEPKTVHQFATGIVSRKTVQKSVSHEKIVKEPKTRGSKSPNNQILDTHESKTPRLNITTRDQRPSSLDKQSPKVSPLSPARTPYLKSGTQQKKSGSFLFKRSSSSSPKNDNMFSSPKSETGKQVNKFDRSKSKTSDKKANGDRKTDSLSQNSPKPLPFSSSLKVSRKSPKIKNKSESFISDESKDSDSDFPIIKIFDIPESEFDKQLQELSESESEITNDNKKSQEKSHSNKITKHMRSSKSSSQKRNTQYREISPNVLNTFEKSSSLENKSPKNPFGFGGKLPRKFIGDGKKMGSFGNNSPYTSSSFEKNTPKASRSLSKNSKNIPYNSGRNSSKVLERYEKKSSNILDSLNRKSQQTPETKLDNFETESSPPSKSWMTVLFGGIGKVDRLSPNKSEKNKTPTATIDQKAINGSNSLYKNVSSSKVSKKYRSKSNLGSFITALNQVDRQENEIIDAHLPRPSGEKEHISEIRKLENKPRHTYSYRIRSTDGDTYEIEQSTYSGDEKKSDLETDNSLKSSSPPGIFQRTIASIFETFDNISSPFQYKMDGPDDNKEESKHGRKHERGGSHINSRGFVQRESRNNSPGKISTPRSVTPYRIRKNTVEKSKSFNSPFRSKSQERMRKSPPYYRNTVNSQKVQLNKSGGVGKRVRSRSPRFERKQNSPFAKKKPIYEFDRFGRRVLVESGTSKHKSPIIVSRSLDGLVSKPDLKTKPVPKYKTFYRDGSKKALQKLNIEKLPAKKSTNNVVTSAGKTERKQVQKSIKDKRVSPGKGLVDKLAIFDSTLRRNSQVAKDTRITGQGPKETQIKGQRPKETPIKGIESKENKQDDKHNEVIETKSNYTKEAPLPKTSEQNEMIPTYTEPDKETYATDRSYHNDERSTKSETYSDTHYANTDHIIEQKSSTWKELFAGSINQTAVHSDEKPEGPKETATNPKRYVSSSSSNPNKDNSIINTTTPKQQIRANSILRRRKSLRKDGPTSFRMSGKNLVKITPPDPTIVDHMKECIADFLIDWKQRNDECYIFHSENRDNNVLKSNAVADAVSKDAVDRETRRQSPSPPRTTQPLSRSNMDNINAQLCSAQQPVAICNNVVVSPEMLYRDVGLSPALQQFPDVSKIMAPSKGTSVDSSPANSNTRVDDISQSSEPKTEIVFHTRQESCSLDQEYCRSEKHSLKQSSVDLDLGTASHHNIVSHSLPDTIQPPIDFGFEHESKINITYSEKEEVKVPCLIEERDNQNATGFETSIETPITHQIGTTVDPPTIEFHSLPSVRSPEKEYDFESKYPSHLLTCQEKLDENRESLINKSKVQEPVREDRFSMLLSPLAEMSETNTDSLSPLLKTVSVLQQQSEQWPPQQEHQQLQQEQLQQQQQSSESCQNITLVPEFSFDAMKEQLQAVVQMKQQEQNTTVEIGQEVVEKLNAIDCVTELVNVQVQKTLITIHEPKNRSTIVPDTLITQPNEDSVEHILNTSSTLSLSQKIENDDRSIFETPTKVSPSSSISSHEHILSSTRDQTSSDPNMADLSLIRDVKKRVIERALKVCSDSRLLEKIEDSSSEASIVSRREPILPAVEGDSSTIDFDSSNKLTTVSSKSTFKTDTETSGTRKGERFPSKRLIIDSPNPEELSRTTVSEIFYGLHRSKDKDESPPYRRFRSSCFTPYYGYNRPRSMKRQHGPESHGNSSTPWFKAYQRNNTSRQKNHSPKRMLHKNITSNKTVSDQSLNSKTCKIHKNRTHNKSEESESFVTSSTSSASTTKYPRKRPFELVDEQIRSALELEDKIMRNLEMGSRCVSPTY